MREIKFRAWDKNLEFMIEPGYLSLDGNGLQSVFYDNCDAEESAWESDVRDIELMQYTGLKDKNGVEIYERDIVLTNNRDKWQVIFGSGRFGVCDEDFFCLTEFAFCEVIGNIYENKELLNEK